MENNIVDIKNVLNIQKIAETSKDVVIPKEEVEIIEPEKRKRGRPRKHPIDNTTTIQTK